MALRNESQGGIGPNAALSQSVSEIFNRLQEEWRAMTVLSLQTHSFADVLRENASHLLKKGERTQRLLLAATAELLQSTRPHQLKVTDITRGAGVSQGAFYQYYADRHAVCRALMAEYAEAIYQTLELASTEADSGQRLTAATEAYVMMFYHNRGLMRCMLQLADEDEQFGGIYQQLNARWNQRVANALAHRVGKTRALAEHWFNAYALSAMTDELLATIYVRSDPKLQAFASQPQQVAKHLSDLWKKLL